MANIREMVLLERTLFNEITSEFPSRMFCADGEEIVEACPRIKSLMICRLEIQECFEKVALARNRILGVTRKSILEICSPRLYKSTPNLSDKMSLTMRHLDNGNYSEAAKILEDIPDTKDKITTINILQSLNADFERLKKSGTLLNAYLCVFLEIPRASIIAENILPDYANLQHSFINNFQDFCSQNTSDPGAETYLSLLTDFPEIFCQTIKAIEELSFDEIKELAVWQGWADRLRNFGSYVRDSGIVECAKDLRNAIRTEQQLVKGKS